MHSDTLRRQLRQGRIRSVRIGKLWRIPESVLTAPDSAPAPVQQKTMPSENALLYAQPVPEFFGEQPDLSALFTPPTPAEIARRLAAINAIGHNLPPRDPNAPETDLSPEADSYGYGARGS